MRVLFGVLVLLLSAAPARAGIRVYDVATGAVGTPVRGEKSLAGWTDDGTAVYVTDGLRTLRVDVATRATTRVEPLDGVQSIGPGGRAVTRGDDALELRQPDGRVVPAPGLAPAIYAQPEFAWSRDGSLVAVTTGPAIGSSGLLVVDTATGTQILYRRGVDGITPQAFAPDRSALLASDGDRIVRIALPGGAASTILSTRYGEAAWGPDGRIATTNVRRLRIDGAQQRVGGDSVHSPLWGADGRLAVVAGMAPDACSDLADGVVLVTGGRASVLVEPSDRELRGMRWSPDGRRLAVDLGPEPAADHRGKRRPWPRRVARDYQLFSARGNAAMRRVVLRASRALRRGAARETVLRRVRLDYAEVDRRFREAGDTAVREALAAELDRWLVAAGFEPIEAFDEITC